MILKTLELHYFSVLHTPYQHLFALLTKCEVLVSHFSVFTLNKRPKLVNKLGPN